MVEPETQTVAVVVPVHNGAGYLAETLQAVAAQTHRALEVVLVDDGSSDDPATAAKGIDLPLRWIRNPKPQGVSRARNAGLAATTAPFVCFLDQDDIWHPEHLSRQLHCFSQRPACGAVVSPYQHWYRSAAGYPGAATLWPADTGGAVDPTFTGWVYHQFMLDCWALTSATMLRRSALQCHGAFDEALPFSEDWDLWLRLSRQVEFAKLQGPPVLYRQHAQQGSRKARQLDYRCQLLLANAQRYGLASRDGRAVDQGVFRHTIARYQAEFGYHHLQYGDAAVGTRSLWRAWRRRPLNPRLLAWAVAGSLGWRPAAPLGRDNQAAAL